MKKDFVIILILLMFAVIGVYVSCTSSETDITAGKKSIEKLTFSRIDSPQIL